MSDLNRIKPAFRTKGAVTGNFGKSKVKAGSTLNDIGVTSAEVINVTRPEDYYARLQDALTKTDNPKLRVFIQKQLKDMDIQRGKNLERLDHTSRTAPPYRTPGC